MSLPWKKVARARDEAPEVTPVLCLILSEQRARAGFLYYSEQEIWLDHLSSSQEFTNSESFVRVVDACLQELGAESEQTNEIVFCLSEDWANAQDVLPEKAPWIKRMLKETGLEAKGFLSLKDALLGFLMQRGQASTPLVFFLFAHSVVLHLRETGGEWSSIQAGRSESITADVTELLARAFPESGSRQLENCSLLIASLDESEASLEIIHQELIEYDWLGVLALQAPPAIELLSAERLGEQLSRETVRVLRSKTRHLPLTSPSEGGSDLTTAPADLVREASQSFFGDSVASQLPQALSSTPTPELTQSEQVEGGSAPTSVSIPAFESPSFSELSLPSESSPPFQPRFKRVITRRQKLVALSLSICLGFLTALLVLALYLRQVAVLELVLTPQLTPISQEVSLLLTANQVKIGDYTLNLKNQEEVVEVTGNRVTTGTTEIGEKATGKVRILNKTEYAKLLEKGVSLTSAEGVVLLLTQEVTLPAASVSASATGTSETKDYGQAEVSVEAKQIGEAGNLQAGSELKVADFATSTYAAETSQALTGGSSQTISLVTNKDVDALLTDLEKQARLEAEKQFALLREQGLRVSPPHQVTLVRHLAEPKVDDPGEEVRVTASYKVTALSFQTSETLPLARSVLADQLASNQVLSEQEPQVLIDFETATQAGQLARLRLNVSSQAEAKLDLTAVRSALADRPLKAVAESAVELPGVKTIHLRWQPGIARYLRRSLPSSPDRLRLTVATPKP